MIEPGLGLNILNTLLAVPFEIEYKPDQQSEIIDFFATEEGSNLLKTTVSFDTRKIGEDKITIDTNYSNPNYSNISLQVTEKKDEEDSPYYQITGTMQYERNGYPMDYSVGDLLEKLIIVQPGKAIPTSSSGTFEVSLSANDQSYDSDFETKPQHPIEISSISFNCGTIYQNSGLTEADFQNIMNTTYNTIKNTLLGKTKEYSAYASVTSFKDKKQTTNNIDWKPVEVEVSLFVDSYTELNVPIKYNVKIINKSGLEYTYKDEFDTVTRYVIESKPQKLTATLTLGYISQSVNAIVDYFYPQNRYLGLFTQMPSWSESNQNWSSGIEPTHKENLPDGEGSYIRMDLLRGVFSDEIVFGEIEQVKNHSDQSLVGKSQLKNKEIIMFPEVLDEAGWGTIVGFGLFDSQTPQEEELPYFWAELAQPVEINKSGSVPLFRPEEFAIYLG